MPVKKYPGPYKAVPVDPANPEGSWKVVNVIRRHVSLEVIEQRRARELQRIEYPNRPPRPIMSEEAYQALRAKAGTDIVRDIDGAKLYPQRQGAYRYAAALNRQCADDEVRQQEADEAEYAAHAAYRRNHVDILRGSFGCASTDHADIDPYWEYAGDWLHAAGGDGRSYSGVLETIDRLPEESDDAFLERCRQRASELDRELQCPRCFPVYEYGV